MSNPDLVAFVGQNGPLSLSALADKGLNYLHFGGSLVGTMALIEHFGRRGRIWTTELRKNVDSLPHTDAKSRQETADVLEFLAGVGRRKFPLELLAAEHDRSLRWRELARRLDCRGFSFRLCESPVFRGCTFSPEVNRSFALLADRGLYYPPKVRHALQSTARDARNRHLANSIGWMLAMEKNRNNRKWWYVVNVQSDLMSSGQSALREQFRGWQRILFWILIQAARRHGVAMLAVPSVEAVTSLRKQRRAWRPLYDGLARSFAMRSAANPYPTNIQPLLFHPHGKHNHRFYVGAVRRLSNFVGVDDCGLIAASRFVEPDPKQISKAL